MTSILFLLLLNMGVSHGNNDGWFRSQARVIKLEPVIRPDRAALPKTHCPQLGQTVANSMVQDIRQQEDKMTRQLACKARIQASNRVIGYWVTYDYNGHEGRKYMSEKPGRWIPVTVNLQPVRAASKR